MAAPLFSCSPLRFFVVLLLFFCACCLLCFVLVCWLIVLVFCLCVFVFAVHVFASGLLFLPAFVLCVVCCFCVFWLLLCFVSASVFVLCSCSGFSCCLFVYVCSAGAREMLESLWDLAAVVDRSGVPFGCVASLCLCVVVCLCETRFQCVI